jgi:hypothetical protein
MAGANSSREGRNYSTQTAADLARGVPRGYLLAAKCAGAK